MKRPLNLLIGRRTALSVFALAAVVANLSLAAFADDIPAEARQTIATANADWLPAMKRQDAAAVAAPYANDGLFVAATGQTAVGPEGVARLMRERFAATRVIDGSLVQDGLRLEGTMIYEWGHADLRLARPSGGEVASSGRYLTVWKRGTNGRWMIIRNLSLGD